jgi:hypothetical protein
VVNRYEPGTVFEFDVVGGVAYAQVTVRSATESPWLRLIGDIEPAPLDANELARVVANDDDSRMALVHADQLIPGRPDVRERGVLPVPVRLQTAPGWRNDQEPSPTGIKRWHVFRGDDSYVVKEPLSAEDARLPLGDRMTVDEFLVHFGVPPRTIRTHIRPMPGTAAPTDTGPPRHGSSFPAAASTRWVNTDDYWALVDQARAGVNDPSDIEAVAARLVDVLVELGPERIVAADEEFQTLSAAGYNWSLWGAAYLIKGGASDDAFDYFRGWLIGHGRQVFEAALADPDSLADVVTVDDADEAECEALLGAARDAYRRATSADLPMGSIIRLPQLGDSWDFDDEAECRRRYPRLTEIFF